MPLQIKDCSDMKRQVLILSLLVMAITALDAKVVLPSVFSDNMVLQQQSDVAFWGKAEPGKKVTVSASWMKSKVVVLAGDDGKWSTTVQTPTAGGPYEITFNDGDRLTLDNVLIGEVWICSGQSNMQMPMEGFQGQPVKDAAEYIMTAKSSVPVRSCNFVRTKSFDLLDDCEAKWYEHTPDGVAEASAVAYFFARRLHEVLDVPVGVINLSWGSTPIEAWMDPKLLAEEFPQISLSHIETRQWPHKKPHQAAGVLYNAMLYPLAGYTAKGFIWYQGCSNGKDPQLYKMLQPAFVRMLRRDWRDDKMPFYYTQLAQYKTINPELRWVQAQNLAEIPYSGMATAFDVGEYDCIHPANKKVVGDRLAYIALEKDYGYDRTDACTPVPVSFEFADGEAIVNFQVGKLGLSPRRVDIDGFELAGEDGVFYPAKARVAEDGGKYIKVYKCPEVKRPVAVRYGMEYWCTPTLYNCYGIPASPFRSDN